MRLNRLYVIPVRGCVVGVVGAHVTVLTDGGGVINHGCRRSVLNGVA